MSDHTPGPWSLLPGVKECDDLIPELCMSVSAEGWNNLALVVVAMEDGDDKQAKIGRDNARIIKIAPDLFETCLVAKQYMAARKMRDMMSISEVERLHSLLETMLNKVLP